MVRFWENLSTDEIADEAKKGSWAIMPMGSLEQHGHHLPVGTDSKIMDAMVGNLEVLEEMPGRDFIVLPVLKIGMSKEHYAAPGTIAFSIHTYVDIIQDIVTCLKKDGFKTVIILNSHGGNTDLINGLAHDLHTDLGIRVFAVHGLDVFMGNADPETDWPHSFHAGMAETSMMLSLYPELVGPLPKESENRNLNGFDALEEMDGKYHWGWNSSEINADGYIGSPWLAEAAKGRVIFEEGMKGLESIIQAISKTFSGTGRE